MNGLFHDNIAWPRKCRGTNYTPFTRQNQITIEVSLSARLLQKTYGLPSLLGDITLCQFASTELRLDIDFLLLVNATEAATLIDIF
jgi:hypothetical protein